MKPECKHIEPSLSSFLDGLLPEAEHRRVQAHVSTCAACEAKLSELCTLLHDLDTLPEVPPENELRPEFLEWAKEERRVTAPDSQTVPFYKRRLNLPVWGHVAAAACVAFAAVGGTLLLERPHQQVAATEQRISQLEDRLDAMGRLVLQDLPNTPTEPMRLQAVQTLEAGERSTLSTLALLQSLKRDPSTNVRLSALEALYPQAHQQHVSAGVAAALRQERSPLVQLAMVDFLGSLGDEGARMAAEALSNNSSSPEKVRTQARQVAEQPPF